jgi:hypothetical protein
MTGRSLSYVGEMHFVLLGKLQRAGDIRYDGDMRRYAAGEPRA